MILYHLISPPLQVLQPDFRLDYCLLWQALIKGDMPGVEQYSRRMGAGELYPLFACVLTARSWTAVNAGISSMPVTHSEVSSHTHVHSVIFNHLTKCLRDAHRGRYDNVF